MGNNGLRVLGPGTHVPYVRMPRAGGRLGKKYGGEPWWAGTKHNLKQSVIDDILIAF